MPLYSIEIKKGTFTVAFDLKTISILGPTVKDRQSNLSNTPFLFFSLQMMILPLLQLVENGQFGKGDYSGVSKRIIGKIYIS